MSSSYIKPTEQQQAIISHDGNAFVSACPGAGKTRVLVERAHRILGRTNDRRGIAFLSFTNAAISELSARLTHQGNFSASKFPNFVGTFDGFLWSFLIAPFGIPPNKAKPKLVPDKKDWKIKPYPKAHPLPLSAFDRTSGKIIPEEAGKENFKVLDRNCKPYEEAACRLLAESKARGHIDFEDVRKLVKKRLALLDFANRLGEALAGRFREVIVDEAQDCNPDDLEIVDWLRKSGVVVKVICDPQQAIYEFRGGVTEELAVFRTTFEKSECFELSGNFRSTPAICKAVSLFRPEGQRTPDRPLGENRDDTTPIHILAYPGSVNENIGSAFHALTVALHLKTSDCVVLASTHESARNSVGQAEIESRHSTLCLATAVSDFHSSPLLGDRKAALDKAHETVLSIKGALKGRSYHRFLTENDLKPGEWRPEMIALLRELAYDPSFSSHTDWLDLARSCIKRFLPSGISPARCLPNHKGLSSALHVRTKVMVAKTIHSVKGQEFEGVCVVLPRQVGRIVSKTLTCEELRKVYVAASRPKRLLAFAVPSSQSSRLAALLSHAGAVPVIEHVRS